MGTDALQVRRNGDFYYPIYFEDGFEKLADAIRTEGLENRNFCIVTDTNVAPLYAAEVQKVLSPVASKISVFTFEAGEKSKNLNTVQQLYKVLIEEKLDRKSLIIALGGGVVGDLAGFGAATYLRGIDFIQVPTTLLSQVDSSVGGKTGVDLEQYKNMVGAFHQPRLVYMNLHTLFSSGRTVCLWHGRSLEDRAYLRRRLLSVCVCGAGKNTAVGYSASEENDSSLL